MGQVLLVFLFCVWRCTALVMLLMPYTTRYFLRVRFDLLSYPK